jgi:hypothetical protein
MMRRCPQRDVLRASAIDVENVGGDFWKCENSFFQDKRKAMTMKLTAFFAAAICLVFWTGVGFASLINVDIGTGAGTYSGAAVVGASGDTWNAITSVATTSLVDANNNGTSATMSIVGSNGIVYHTDTVWGSTGFEALMCDYLYASNNVTVTLNHIAAGTYDLYLYGVGKDSFSTNAATWVAATSVGSNSVSVGPNTGNITEFSSGKNYGVVEVTVGDNGVLTLTGTPVTGGSVILNGFQLQSVPEPASASLLTCTAVIGLLAYAWRKRRR